MRTENFQFFSFFSCYNNQKIRRRKTCKQYQPKQYYQKINMPMYGLEMTII